MIGFYLNASQKIGLGHFNRNLLIYKLIKKKSLFFTESVNLKKILKKKKNQISIFKKYKKFIINS